VVKEIVHESGRGAPVAKVQFQNAYRFKRDNETFVAVEGLYSGQFIYAGKKGEWRRHMVNMFVCEFILKF
jgi:large subunit ribosomal protein L8e